MSGPRVELRGTLVNDDGQQAGLTVRAQFGDLGRAMIASGEGSAERRMAVRGTVELTNSTTRINVPAASVLVVVQAGYPSRSQACRSLPPPDGERWARYCWYLLAVASPYGEDNDLTALQPGEQRVRALTTSASGFGQLRVAGSDVAEVGAALQHPAVVVATTSAVNYDGSRLRAGCGTDEMVAEPSASASQASASQEQPAVPQYPLAATTRTVACQDFRYLGP